MNKQRHVIQVVLHDADFLKLTYEAERQGISDSAYTRKLIRSYFAKLKQPDKSVQQELQP